MRTASKLGLKGYTNETVGNTDAGVVVIDDLSSARAGPSDRMQGLGMGKWRTYTHLIFIFTYLF